MTDALPSTKPAGPSRRLAAVMLADVAGYSAMMERDEAGTHLRLREVRTQITDPAIERHYGRIVRSRGDDLLVEFASAVEALSCAVEIQRAMAEYNRGLAAASRIEFRIGVNLGDILIDGTDIAGAAAARYCHIVARWPWSRRQESNLYLSLRRTPFCPLNYGEP